MDEYQRKVLELLGEIRLMIEPISEMARHQFLQDKVNLLKSVVTSKNKKILPLLFDARRLSQARIAEEAGVSQPTVSRLISDLKAKHLITEEKDENFNTRFVDTWRLQDFFAENLSE